MSDFRSGGVPAAKSRWRVPSAPEKRETKPDFKKIGNKRMLNLGEIPKN